MLQKTVKHTVACETSAAGCEGSGAGEASLLRQPFGCLGSQRWKRPVMLPGFRTGPGRGHRAAEVHDVMGRVSSQTTGGIHQNGLFRREKCWLVIHRKKSSSFITVYQPFSRSNPWLWEPPLTTLVSSWLVMSTTSDEPLQSWRWSLATQLSPPWITHWSVRRTRLTWNWPRTACHLRSCDVGSRG